jgi:hypothetical protein
MELDELKGQWQALERKLDRSVALNLQVLTESRTRRGKLRLLPLMLLQPFQIAIGLVITIYAANFWIANRDVASLLISGIALHAGGVGLIIDAVMRIVLIARINYAAPVVTIQRYLAYLRQWEIRSFKWGWMAVWALIPAAFIVAVKSLTTLDLWARWPQGVLWTAGVSAIVMLASYVFDRFARGRWPNLYVGYSVAGAQAALDEIDQFTRE